MSLSATTDASTQALIDRHDASLSPNYKRFPVAIGRGQGAHLWGVDGKAYLDLFAGFGAPLLGHCHPELVEAVTGQANRLWHVGNLLHTEPQVELAERLRDASGFDARPFFCHSGADSNDAAIKVARLYGKANPGASKDEHGRYKVVATQRSFHGRSFGTMGATANPAVRHGFAPLPPGYAHGTYDDVASIEAQIDAETVAILAEPVQGEGGIHVPSPSFFPALRAMCDKHDLLLIADEVWTGCGRTGRWFGHHHWGVQPDLMTLGKGVGGGLALGACCIAPRLADLVDPRVQGGVKHATTLGGNCLTMAVAAKLMEVIERDGLVERAARVGEQIKDRLRDGLAKAPVRDIRGLGLFLGVELDLPADTAGAKAREFVLTAMDKGVMVNGTASGVLRLAPPLTIEEDDLHRGLDTLIEVLCA
ncbi:MAG: aminotransferase class III-fold pyridoxal phosphate-dependent enzyme [Planctomycetota bacterium]